MSLAYLIDTDWIIDHFHGVEAVTRRLGELRPAGLAISMISLAELYEGVHYSRDPARRHFEAVEGLKILSLA